MYSTTKPWINPFFNFNTCDKWGKSTRNNERIIRKDICLSDNKQNTLLISVKN